MKTIRAGDVSDLICNKCEALRPCVYSYGPCEYDGEMVEDILRSICPVCESVVTISSRSTYRFAEAKARKAQKRTSVMLPIEMQDDIAKELIDAGSSWTHFELYFRALLVAAHNNPRQIAQMVADLNDDILTAPRGARMNVCLGERLTNTLEGLTQESGVKSTSETLRRLIVLSKEPVLCESLRKELKTLALALS